MSEVKVIRGIAIRTSFDPKPIPTTAYDWCAWVDGDEERMEYGWGSTEEVAVRELLELLEEK